MKYDINTSTNGQPWPLASKNLAPHMSSKAKHSYDGVCVVPGGQAGSFAVKKSRSKPTTTPSEVAK